MRKAKIRRKTTETDIQLELNLDGRGRRRVRTDIPFMNHMLELFAMHSGFDLAVRAKGDTEVDDHHLMEDLGIVTGDALKKALGNKKGITRYGNFLVPMDEAASFIALDISGRPYLKYSVRFNRNFRWMKNSFDYTLLEEFFRALVSRAGITLHVMLKYGSSNHHIAESVFKGFGRALAQAVSIRKGRKTVPSTKGRL